MRLLIYATLICCPNTALPQYAREAERNAAPGGQDFFMLRQRAQHVLEEAKRVLDFKAVCEVGRA